MPPPWLVLVSKLTPNDHKGDGGAWQQTRSSMRGDNGHRNVRGQAVAWLSLTRKEHWKKKARERNVKGNSRLRSGVHDGPA
jgi:hypothetical protein